MSLLKGHGLTVATPDGTAPYVRRPDPPKYTDGGLVDPRDHPACCPLEIVDAARGVLRDPRGRTKVGIIGFWPNTRDLAPYDDPDWILLGCNQLYRYIPRTDLWTEVHTPDNWAADVGRVIDYPGWLRQQPLPVLVAAEEWDSGQAHPSPPRGVAPMPGAVRYPIEQAIELAGGIGRVDGSTDPLDYFQSTIAFQLAWAILFGAKEIGVWGVDLTTDSEYQYQKPNAEFWLGFAKGAGIRVTLPPATALLKGLWRYGRPGADDPGLIHKRMIERRVDHIRQERAKVEAAYKVAAQKAAQEEVEALKTMDQMDAAITESELWHEVYVLKSRGTSVDYDDPLPSMMGGTSS